MGIINDNNSENQVSQQKLIDQTGSGNVFFYRVFTFDAEDDGALLSVEDYDLDGNPYTVVGTVVCETDVVFNDAVAAGKINADGSVASIFNATCTRLSAGLYRITFLTVQPTNNYPIMLSVEKTAGSDDIISHYDSVTPSSFDVHIYEQDNGGSAGDPIDNAFSFFIPNLSGSIQTGVSHSVLSGLGADDHTQYLTEGRHDSLPSDNPHGVTASQTGAYTTSQTDTQIANAIATHESDPDPHANYETSAQLDARDAANRDRANHTGTQLHTTISDFDSGVYGALDRAYISTDTQISTSSTTLQNAQTLTINVPAGGGTYRICWYYEWSFSSVSDDFEARVVLNSSTVISEHIQEPKDPGIDQLHPVCGFVELDLSSGANTVDILYRTSDSSDTSFIQRRRISIQRIA